MFKLKKLYWLGVIVLLIVSFVLGRKSTVENEEDEEDGAVVSSSAEAEEHLIWTCPMHPQIRQDGPGTCPICHMDLVPVSSGGGQEMAAIQLSEGAQRLAQVQNGFVESGPLMDKIDVYGAVDVNEESEVDLAAWTGGRIERLLVSAVGEEVQEGDLLAQIYSPEILATQQALLQVIQNAASAREAGSERRLRAAEAARPALRSQLRLLGVSSRQIQAIEAGGQPQETVDVYATASGTVRSRNVSEGDYVEEGDSILSLAALDSVWGQLEIYEGDLRRVAVGMPVTATTPALGGEKLEGRISFISPQIDEQKRIARARVVLPNEDGHLRPGMYLNATIDAPYEDEEVLSVPKSAVLWTGQRSLVYLYDRSLEPAGYVPREVELGPRVADRYVIKDGLKEGDEIAIRGAFRIDASLQIQNPGATMMSIMHGGELQERESPELDVEEQSEEVLSRASEAVSAYDKLRARLADDTTEGVGEHAATLEEAALAAREDATDEFAPRLEELAAKAEHFKHLADDADIDAVRLEFGELSRAMVAVLAGLPALNDELYIYECPMTEGYRKWIQVEEEMANPYMGKAMLQCGSPSDWMGGA
ncbi:MAG: efflux RND transporter periplasmic adaptor subunit [Bradymonadaceae bacterium]